MITAPRREHDPDDRPRSFETIDGEVVMYDRTNPEAWIQSSVAVDFEDIWSTDDS